MCADENETEKTIFLFFIIYLNILLTIKQFNYEKTFSYFDAVVTFANGWAQFGVGNYVTKGNFIYQITVAAAGANPGEVVLYGIRDGYNPVDESKALNLEGKITIGIVDGPSFDFIVTTANATALRNTYNFTTFDAAPTLVGPFAGMVIAESVVIPKEFQTIVANTFYGYTNMKAISFQEESEVETIQSGAFNTTQISSFDFSNCSKLTTIENGLFVEADPAVNSYVENVWLPEASEALVTIGTAFQRLPNLQHVYNLENSKITTVAQDAFKGDVNLEEIALPGTVVTIAENAFRGSGITTLTIDVTSLNDLTSGNVYGAGDDLTTLESLTLTGVLSGTFKPQAFKGCTKLETIDMTGMTITGGTIGASAFEGCTKLAALTFNPITGVDDTHVGTIGENAFKECTKLATLTFNGITGFEAAHPAVIGASAFEGCTKLGTIAFNGLENVTILAKAFKSCVSGAVTTSSLSFGPLTNVTIVGTDDTDGAFNGTSKLTSISFGVSENLTINDFAFKGTASAGNAAALSFGDATNIVIGESAFIGAEKVETITFGNIEDDATPSPVFRVVLF